MIARKTKPITIVILYAILIAGVIFSVFPIYFVAQAAFRPGNQLYSTELQLFPTNASLHQDWFSHHHWHAAHHGARRVCAVSLPVSQSRRGA